MPDYTICQLADDYVAARMKHDPHHYRAYLRESRRLVEARIDCQDLIGYYLDHGSVSRVSVPGITPNMKGIVDIILEAKLAPVLQDIGSVFEAAPNASEGALNAKPSASAFLPQLPK